MCVSMCVHALFVCCLLVLLSCIVYSGGGDGKLCLASRSQWNVSSWCHISLPSIHGSLRNRLSSISDRSRHKQLAIFSLRLTCFYQLWLTLELDTTTDLRKPIWFHPPGPDLIYIFYSVQTVSIQFGIFQLQYHFCVDRNPLTYCVVRNIINVYIKNWIKCCWRFMVESVYGEMDGVLQCCNEK